jgi:ribonuclease HI
VERHDDKALIIYTDGSCLAKPRRGGYAYRLVAIDPEGHEVIEDYSFPGFLGATNNQMELMACAEALKHVAGRRPPIPRDWYEKVVIYTDSTYVLDGVYPAEIAWPTNGWLTRDGDPVLNPDLWIDLVREKQRARRVGFRRVEGHKSNPHNKAVDKLAKDAAQRVRAGGALPKRLMPAAPIVRRRTSTRKTDPLSVVMRGQTETVRIVAARPIPGQQHHAYKYEIVRQDSPDFEAVDDAFALNEHAAMRPGHCYEVRFAGQGEGRWIREVIREIQTT